MAGLGRVILFDGGKFLIDAGVFVVVVVASAAVVVVVMLT